MKTYWHGDEAVYTGRTQYLHGATFYEIRLTEGHLEGQTRLVINGPDDPFGQKK